MRSRACVALALPILALTAAASADIFWNEAVQGDLSNDRLAPTNVALGIGAHTLLATTGGGNLDYLTITLPAGTQLTGLNLVTYEGNDGTAFAAVQAGTILSEPADAPDPANLLGWAHFGPDAGNVGTDILDDLGSGPGAIGFTPPLPGATYTFWLQQLGGPVTYQMDFVVVPAPAAGGMACIAMLMLGRRRR